MIRELLKYGEESITLANFCVTMCNAAISMRKTPGGSDVSREGIAQLSYCGAIYNCPRYWRVSGFSSKSLELSTREGLPWSFLEGLFILFILEERFIRYFVTKSPKDLFICNKITSQTKHHITVVCELKIFHANEFIFIAQDLMKFIGFRFI